jgi:hypothetical protein
MKRLLIAAIACVVLGAFVACGDDDSTSSGSSSASTSAGASVTPVGSADADTVAYFQDLSVIFADGRTRSNSATDELNTKLDASQSLNDQKDAINAFLDTMINVFDDAAGRMDSLDPPDDAKAGHQRFRDDVSQAKDISEGLQSDIADVQSADEATTIINDFNTRVNSLVTDSQSACAQLQGIADGDHTGVSLNCGSS